MAGWLPVHQLGARGTTMTGSSGLSPSCRRRSASVVTASFAREPEVVDFLSQTFGRYPFSASGGIVDDVEGLGFALENQTRPIYALDFFTDEETGTGVIVHELTHQWFGDSVAVARWQDIWLNEGFATYAEWLWSEHDGGQTAQEIADLNYTEIPADDPFWQLTIGDPGPDRALRPRGLLPGWDRPTSIAADDR